ncbi:MAG: DUF2330 domain-containing protein [Solirubrobacteraceae bacterium]
MPAPSACPPPRPRPAGPAIARPVVAVAVAVLVAATALLLLAARPAGACACGVAFDASVSAERALIQLDGDRQELILSLDLAMPSPGDGTGTTRAAPTPPSGRRPAVVLPVPSTPRVTQVDEDQAGLFAELAAATAPTPAPSDDDDGDGATAGAPTGGVDVISRETLGGYDVSVLRAGEAGALRRWLDRHGYATPAAVEPVLSSYVRRKWAFVAFRLAGRPEAGEHALRPLRIRFRNDRLIYPLQLSGVGTAPVSVELYVAGGHRVVAEGFDTHYAGPVAGITSRLTPPVRDLLTGGYLTRLEIRNRRPQSITGDVLPEQATSDRAFQPTGDYPFESADGFGTAPLPTAEEDDDEFDGPPVAAWLLLFPLLGVMLVGVRLLLHRRGRTS